jgi:hypothetical protein
MNRIWQEVKSAMTVRLTSNGMRGQGHFLMLFGFGWFILTCLATHPTFYEPFLGARPDHLDVSLAFLVEAMFMLFGQVIVYQSHIYAAVLAGRPQMSRNPRLRPGAP